MKRTLLLVLALLLFSAMAQAATWYVATTGSDANPGTQAQPFRTIGKGIATAAANGDTILVVNGTYNEHDLDFGAKNLVLQSQSGNPAACILNCQQAGRGIRIAGGQTATTSVSGLMIQNGIALITVTDAGGMLISNASPTITNCIFSANSNNGKIFAASALYVGASSNPNLMGCTFQNNSGPHNTLGGTTAIDGGATATMTNCTFSGNTVGGLGGGGINVDGGSLTLKSCTFTNNAAGYGGGINLDRNGTVVADRCTFTGNHASRTDVGGGGICTGFGDMTLTNCVFVNNTSAPDSDLGDTRINGQSITLQSTGNTAPVKIINCTFTGTWTGVTTVANISSYSANLVLVNSIIRGGDSGFFFGDLFTSGGSVSVTNSNTQRGYTGTGNITADPQFVNPAVGNYRLQATSPCLNTGSAAAPGLPATDFDGGPRLLGNAPDMGAYETWLASSGAWFVDKVLGNDTTGNGSPSAPFKTVVKAIASASNGHKLYIKQGSYGTDRPRITKSLRLFNWLDTGLSRVGQP